MSSTERPVPPPARWGSPADVHRSTYRVFCVLAAVLNPVFGGVYRFTDPEAIDPPWLRLVLSLGILLLLSLSHMVRWMEQHFITLVQSYFYVLTVFYVGLTAINGFSPNYSMGMLFAFTAMGVAFSLGLTKHLAPLNYYLLFSLLVTTAACVVTPTPEVSPWILLACAASTALIIYVVAAAKIKVERAAESSGRRYHTLMQAANDAILISDPASWMIVDANQKALDLLGRTLEEVRRASVTDLFPRDDRDRFVALFEAHVYEGKPMSEDLFIAHRDGHTVAVDLSASLIEVEGRKYIQGIFRDATERHRYEEQLIQAKERAEELLRIKTSQQRLIEEKERAEELLRIKTNLLSNISHEFRTPLTAILGFAEILRDDVTDERRDHAECIVKSSQRLIETVNSVLDLAQLESGAAALEVRPLDVARCLGEVAAMLRHLAEQKGIHLSLIDHSDNAQADADATAVRRIANNLIGNAIKFTERGEIEVTVTADSARVCIHVADTGVGIAPEFLPRVFEDFQQESTGFARSFEGSGLGLAITKRLVDLMEGTIEVQSVKGRGSTFTVSLPATGSHRDGVGNARTRPWAAGAPLRRAVVE